ASPEITGYTPDQASVSGTMGTADVTVDVTYSINSYEVTANANLNAAGSVTGAGTYDHFATASLTATPATGYYFVSWTENDNVVATSATYSFEVTGDRTLVANFDTLSYNIIATANPTTGGSVEGDGSYKHFTNANLTATPATGYYFVSWTENDNVVATSTTYSFEVTGERTLIANFDTLSYNIIATANPTTGGSVEGDGSYKHFTNANLTATPATGYYFVSWTENDNVVATSTTYSFEVTGDRTLVANFDTLSYNIIATANPTTGGSVEGDGSYKHFTNANLTATPATGYYFVSWTENDNVVATSTTYSFEVTGDRTLVANFDTLSYNIIANTNPTTGGSVEGDGSYKHFTNANLTATPATGYYFVSWTENDNVVATSTTYSFEVTGDRTLVANFNLIDYSLTINYKYADGTQAAEPHTEPLNYNESYSVTSPQIAGYVADQTTVAGTMGTEAVTKTITYYLVETSIVDASNCSGNGNGSITVTNPTGNYEYSLDGNNFQTETTFDGLSEGNYNLYIRPSGHEYNYIGEWSVGLTITMPIAAASSTDSVFCLNASIQLSGEGSSTGNNYSYAWSGPASYSSTDMNPAAFEASNGNMTGTYTMTVTDNATNCISSKSINIYVNTATNPDYAFTIRAFDAVGNIDLGQTSATVNILNPIITHYMDNIIEGYSTNSVTYTNDAPAEFTNTGTYNVIWTATDACGNTATCSITVSITEDECTAVQDIDGNIYQSVKIGSNCWMTENLRTTHYADGRSITNIYRYQCEGYPNAEANANTFGLLYDWYDALDSNITRTRAIHKQGICPTGWHIPTDDEFYELINTDLQTVRSTDYWLYNAGNNASGFDMKPAGLYNYNTGRYENLLGNSYLWSATTISTSKARCYAADCNCYLIYELTVDKTSAFSVRCVKNY
ncbi:MAG: hypothetical protein CW341_10580, partial [Bacteroidetes bacterium]|nr:hypothetical protein [Bacteroidota bacterium]